MEIAGKFFSDMGLEMITQHVATGSNQTSNLPTHFARSHPHHWQLQASIKHVLVTSQPYY
jgi:hypothetical protein